MPGQVRILTLNLGSQAISVGDFRPQTGGGLVLRDYQLVGGGADEQLQVVLVAIKSDLLEGINAAVEAAGLRPMVIGVANMALYNAFRYNYSDVTDSSLVVDIGARTTNLLFIE